jgi:hypothetical protein
MEVPWEGHDSESRLRVVQMAKTNTASTAAVAISASGNSTSAPHHVRSYASVYFPRSIVFCAIC